MCLLPPYLLFLWIWGHKTYYLSSEWQKSDFTLFWNVTIVRNIFEHVHIDCGFMQIQKRLSNPSYVQPTTYISSENPLQMNIVF